MWQTHDAFLEAAGRPSPETINEGGGPCKGVGAGCEFSGPCDDIWYFKRSFDDNGRGLVRELRARSEATAMRFVGWLGWAGCASEALRLVLNQSSLDLKFKSL